MFLSHWATGFLYILIPLVPGDLSWVLLTAYCLQTTGFWDGLETQVLGTYCRQLAGELVSYQSVHPPWDPVSSGLTEVQEH